MQVANPYRDLDEFSFKRKLIENIKDQFADLLTAEDVAILEKGDDASLSFLAQKYFKMFSERN